jgi:hypothetical protein
MAYHIIAKLRIIRFIFFIKKLGSYVSSIGESCRKVQIRAAVDSVPSRQFIVGTVSILPRKLAPWTEKKNWAEEMMTSAAWILPREFLGWPGWRGGWALIKLLHIRFSVSQSYSVLVSFSIKKFWSTWRNLPQIIST